MVGNIVCFCLNDKNVNIAKRSLLVQKGILFLFQFGNDMFENKKPKVTYTDWEK